MVRVPTDTPPGDNTPHAARPRSCSRAWDSPSSATRCRTPSARARPGSVTNLVVRQRFGDGPTIALNAHGDVVPPGKGWTHPPYGGEIDDGRMYGRGVAVSKSDFATYAYALRALAAVGRSHARHRRAALHLRRGDGRRARPRVAAGAKASRARLRDLPGLLLRGRHRAQRLPAARSDRARARRRMRRCPRAASTRCAPPSRCSTRSTRTRRARARHSHVDGIDAPTLNVGRSRAASTPMSCPIA